MSWDLKYRPVDFESVLGQRSVVEVLSHRVLDGTGFQQSYILFGPHGSGKTTLARILARALLCEHPTSTGSPCNTCATCTAFLADRSPYYEERDAAGRGKIEDIRSIVDGLDYVSQKQMIVTFDEAHRMSKDSQDVLLKPIEENRITCIFCTTEPSKIRGTIRSRCDDFQISTVSDSDVCQRLAYVCGAEGVSYTDSALARIARYSNGHMRDALKRAEMISRMGPLDVQAVGAHLQLDVVSLMYRVLSAIAADNAGEIIRNLDTALQKVSPADVLQMLTKAALSAYRLGCSCGDSIDPEDRELASEVFDLLGDRLLMIANFLATKYGRLSGDAVVGHALYLAKSVRGGLLVDASAPQTVSGDAVLKSAQRKSAAVPTPVSPRRAQEDLEASAKNRAPLSGRGGALPPTPAIIPVNSGKGAVLSVNQFTSLLTSLVGDDDA